MATAEEGSMETTAPGHEGVTALHASAFRHNLPAQIMLHEIRRLVGKVEGLSCLELSAQPPLFSYHLRKCGGHWSTVRADAAQAADAREVLGEDVPVLSDGRLPFEDRTFDVVVLADLMESLADDTSLVRECHRVLKGDGRLVLSARHAKRWSLIGPLQTLVGLSPARTGFARRGYAETMLFQTLKTGFDMLSARSHRRVLVECVDTFVRAGLQRVPPGSPRRAAVERRMYLAASAFYRVAYPLDLFFFFTRGFIWTVAARRRPWRSRQAPVLTDGRSIPEAVLTRAAD